MRKYLVICFLMLPNFFSRAQIVKSSWKNCSKFLGNISRDLSPNNITTTPENWLNYWNQVTPSNAGKWGFVERTRDVMNWDGLDKAYKLAEDNDLFFKQHVFVWGNQQPDWIDDLSDEAVIKKIKKFKPDLILNFAAQAGVRHSLSNPEDYISNNISSFMNIIKYAKDYEVEKIVYASTSSVYGANTTLPFSEEMTTDHPIQF